MKENGDNHPVYTTFHRIAAADEFRGQGIIQTFARFN